MSAVETQPSERLRVGVVGAGPWAAFVHAPMFAADPRTTLAGIWARRHDAAERLASANGTVACERLQDLLARCDAVAFAVPPDVQADIAVLAARAGKAVLLEKPIALDLDAARHLAEAVEEAGVGSQIVLTWRYTEPVRSFLAAVAAAEPVGGRGHFVSGGLLGGPFATPWRLEHGSLLDLGPHVVDTLDAALGGVTGVRADGDTHGWLGLLLEHESGVTSQVSLCARSAVEPFRAGVEVYTEREVLEVDTASVFSPATMTAVVDDFLETARGTPHPLDVRHGLHLQQILSEALVDLRRAR